MPTHYRGAAEEVLALNTWIKLTRAVESLGARLARRDTIGELTLTQFGVLEMLYHLGPARQGDICAKLLKSAGNITLVIDNLVAKQLVRRERDPDDRRAVMVSLTGAGTELIQQVLPGHVRAITEQMGVLTADEQETLGRLCKKLGRQDS